MCLGMWISGVICTLVLAVPAQRSLPLTVRPIEDVARELGYEIERHNITTSDGYILTYHRLPRGRIVDPTNELPPSRSVLLFNNGILLSSASVLTNQDDFAYEFADAGFDVWLGNYRGNMYSRSHRFLDPDRDSQFWDYSLHELGTLDLPASIDYILGVTGASRLVYVGASMGTTMFWVLGAMRPHYMAKVEAMVAIAPVARTSHAALLSSPVRYNTALSVVKAVEAAGLREVFPYSEMLSSLIHTACSRSWLLRPVCLRLLRVYGYLSGDTWDIERVVEATKYSPAGISTKVLRHFIQIAKARKFQQYDYGQAHNRRHYQADSPPEYDLGNVNCSVIYFINSDVDMIAAREDVAWLSKRLSTKPTRILKESVNRLGHLGLGLDKRVGDVLVRPLAEFLKERFLLAT